MKTNFFDLLTKEVNSFDILETIEQQNLTPKEIETFPFQPLFHAVKQKNSEELSLIISKFSKTQRELFLDADLWLKDEVEASSFGFWVEVYYKNDDFKLSYDFVKSEQFLLYLKSVVNIWTFDTEEPVYPDHDYYFLTDDSLLLIEYSEEFLYPNEIKSLIKRFYSEFGVEEAYAHLFKLVSDSYVELAEREYERKKQRLNEVGLVDYYDSLVLRNKYLTISQLNKFIKGKIDNEVINPNLEIEQKVQSLSKNLLTPYLNLKDILLSEIDKVSELKRDEYLKFNFIKFINSFMSLSGSQDQGNIALKKMATIGESGISLGLEYLKTNFQIKTILDSFDFFDLYIIGHTLVEIENKKLKKEITSLKSINFDFSFLGNTFSNFLDSSDLESKSFFDIFNGKIVQINSLQILENLQRSIFLFLDLMPLILQLYKNFELMKKNNQILSDFYINYKVEDIDWEAILMSSFANEILDENKNEQKFGITIKEAKRFFELVCNKSTEKTELKNISDLSKIIKPFLDKRGLGENFDTEQYFYSILKESLEGYEISSLSDEEFKFIGGPLILLP